MQKNCRGSRLCFTYVYFYFKEPNYCQRITFNIECVTFLQLWEQRSKHWRWVEDPSCSQRIQSHFLVVSAAAEGRGLSCTGSRSRQTCWPLHPHPSTWYFNSFAQLWLTLTFNRSFFTLKSFLQHKYNFFPDSNSRFHLSLSRRYETTSMAQTASNLLYSSVLSITRKWKKMCRRRCLAINIVMRAVVLGPGTTQE